MFGIGEDRRASQAVKLLRDTSCGRRGGSDQNGADRDVPKEANHADVPDPLRSPSRARRPSNPRTDGTSPASSSCWRSSWILVRVGESGLPLWEARRPGDGAGCSRQGMGRVENRDDGATDRGGDSRRSGGSSRFATASLASERSLRIGRRRHWEQESRIEPALDGHAQRGSQSQQRLLRCRRYAPASPARRSQSPPEQVDLRDRPPADASAERAGRAARLKLGTARWLQQPRPSPSWPRRPAPARAGHGLSPARNSAARHQSRNQPSS